MTTAAPLRYTIAQIEKRTRKLEEEIRELKAIRVWMKQGLATNRD